MPAFQRAEIGGDVLLEFNREDFKDMNIALGNIKRLEKALGKLSAQEKAEEQAEEKLLEDNGTASYLVYCCLRMIFFRGDLLDQDLLP